MWLIFQKVMNMWLIRKKDISTLALDFHTDPLIIFYEKFQKMIGYNIVLLFR